MKTLIRYVTLLNQRWSPFVLCLICLFITISCSSSSTNSELDKGIDEMPSFNLEDFDDVEAALSMDEQELGSINEEMLEKNEQETDPLSSLDDLNVEELGESEIDEEQINTEAAAYDYTYETVSFEGSDSFGVQASESQAEITSQEESELFAMIADEQQNVIDIPDSHEEEKSSHMDLKELPDDSFAPKKVSSHSIMKAAKVGVPETLQYILKKGVDINNKNSNGQTALMLASKHGRIENVRLLLSHGASVDIVDNQGKTASRYASENKFLEIVKLLKK
ncbi:MAG: ankyrin repeat domain-containing protein [Bacteriovoracaceae bacterium]|nr:ankyrin repeat domain-containing protein [Bacteriovoracaceae bacterium]